MHSEGILTIFTTLVFIAITVLYVWKIKHPSRSLWKMSVCFFLIMYGIPFVAAMILPSLTGVGAHSVEQVFQISHQASVMVAHLFILTVAVMITLLITRVATKLAKRAPDSKKNADQMVVYYPATERPS